MSIRLKTPAELKILRQGGRRLASVVSGVAAAVRPGVTAKQLDDIAEALIAASGSTPSFKGYSGYPAASCISVNSGVVHGIPRAKTVLKAGDIVGIDIGLVYRGLYTDMAVTVPVGNVSDVAARLMQVTREALTRAIGQVKPGTATGDIGHAVESYVTSQGFFVVKTLVGHGVGHAVHEEPQVPNFGHPGQGVVLKEGMVLALEPMVNVGGSAVETLDDGWTIVTADGSLSAHFEKTVAVTATGVEIITE